MKGERPTRASIDLQALADNYAEAVRLAGGRQVVAVVKAEAYGHGAAEVARRLLGAGCSRLAVASVAEAAALRAAVGDASLVVLGGIHDAAEAADAAEIDAIPVVQHAGHVGLLEKAARERGRSLRVQVEVDTGLTRMGISPEEAPALLTRLGREKSLILDGVYTHLARADERDLAPTREQISLFTEVLRAARSRGVYPDHVHVSNSAAVLRTPDLEAAFADGVDGVRPGLMLYGVLPASHLAGQARLRPVMSLRSRVCNVRHVRPGDAVGYGATFRATQRGRIATVPAGYADGVPWSLGNRGHVLLRGRRVPIAGRVSMDLLSLDVGDGPVEIGDEVVIFGTSAGGSAALPVEEVADAAGTIPYELLVRVGGRVPRVTES